MYCYMFYFEKQHLYQNVEPNFVQVKSFGLLGNVSFRDILK